MTTDHLCPGCGDPVEHRISAIVGCSSCIEGFDALSRIVINVEPIISELAEYLKSAEQSEIDSIPSDIRDQVLPFVTAIRRVSAAQDLMMFALGEWDAIKTPPPYSERLTGRSIADIDRQQLDDDAFRVIIDGFDRTDPQ